ncbi:MAG: DNA-directed RNA polymerase I subunit rpa49 [Caeruleum heppii]|nr:MAG: DNA-directed RNA polymerase I subunit rpa49 [Caeruleum heppii]
MQFLTEDRCEQRDRTKLDVEAYSEYLSGIEIKFSTGAIIDWFPLYDFGRETRAAEGRSREMRNFWKSTDVRKAWPDANMDSDLENRSRILADFFDDPDGGATADGVRCYADNEDFCGLRFRRNGLWDSIPLGRATLHQEEFLLEPGEMFVAIRDTETDLDWVMSPKSLPRGYRFTPLPERLDAIIPGARRAFCLIQPEYLQEMEAFVNTYPGRYGLKAIRFSGCARMSPAILGDWQDSYAKPSAGERMLIKGRGGERITKLVSRFQQLKSGRRIINLIIHTSHGRTQDIANWTSHTEEKPPDEQLRVKELVPPPGEEIVGLHYVVSSSAHPKVDYTAREEADGIEGLQKHYIGVYEPTTGELQVTEARHVVLRSVLREEVVEVQKDEAKHAKLLRDELGRTFGTKKARNAIKSQTENAISAVKRRNDKDASDQAGEATPSKPDRLTTAVLDSIAPAVGDMASKEELQAATDEAKPRPKPNLAAQTPAEVYPLETLVGRDELRALTVKEWQDAAEAGNPITTKSRFVSERLQRVATSGDVRKLKVLRYLLLLLDFYRALKSAQRGGKKLPPREELKEAVEASEFLLEGVKRKFADGSALTKWHVDYLLTHIAALALHIDNFEVNTFDLREDLRLENKVMSTYFRELACKIHPLRESERKKLGISSNVEAAMHRVARLVLPLEFPATKVARRR